MVKGALRHSQKSCLGEKWRIKEFRVVRKDVSVPKSSSNNLLYKRTLPLTGISSCLEPRFVK